MQPMPPLQPREPLRQPDPFYEVLKSLSVAVMGAGSVIAAFGYWGLMNVWGRGLVSYLLIETAFFFLQCWR